MPNWVDNNVIIYGDENVLNDIKIFVQSKDCAFDFDKIVPMPPHSETFFRDGGLSIEEEKKYGRNNWYHWSIDNWGTKWNSCESGCLGIYNNELKYFFQTAWSPALPVLNVLAKKFKVKIKCTFVDEAIGDNCGLIVFDENGDTIEDEYYEENGFNFIAKVYGEDYLYDYGFIKDKDGNWVYEED